MGIESDPQSRPRRTSHGEDRLLVFISSVMNRDIDDLQAEREACVRAIESMPLIRPWAFEHGSASPEAPTERYLRKVDACDIFVAVLGTQITDAVRREYERAVLRDKPRLVFLKNVDRASRYLQDWVRSRQDVSYAYFQDAQDLEIKVRNAVSDELIRGYRNFNLRDQDYAAIATSIRSQPVTFLVRTIEPFELLEVTATFPQLQALYPEFEAWAGRKRGDITRGVAEALVATYGDDTAGFALTTNKDSAGKVRKISTLYIKPQFQNLGIGPRLLFGLIDKAARDQVEKLYITVSEERRQQLEGLLHQYGFFVEGNSGRRYRHGSWEWIWSKRLLHGCLEARRLSAFVRRYLFEERGFSIRPLTPDAFVARYRYGMLGEPGDGQDGVLVATASKDTDREYLSALHAAKEAGLGLVFVSVDGLTVDLLGGTCLDALDLETRFFPLFVERGVEGLIVPIREGYANALIPSADKPSFLAPTRVQLRTENVYYRYPTVFAGLKRGSPLFFYETRRKSGSSRIIGEAKLLDYAVDQPEDLLARYGNLGVYTLEDVRRCVTDRGDNSGKALALRFDWYRELRQPLPRSQIESVVSGFDPTTARRIQPVQVLELRRLAGWSVDALSWR